MTFIAVWNTCLPGSCYSLMLDTKRMLWLLDNAESKGKNVTGLRYFDTTPTTSRQPPLVYNQSLLDDCQPPSFDRRQSATNCRPLTPNRHSTANRRQVPTTSGRKDKQLTHQRMSQKSLTDLRICCTLS